MTEITPEPLGVAEAWRCSSRGAAVARWRCSGRQIGRARSRSRAASCSRSSTAWRCSRRSSRRTRRRRWIAQQYFHPPQSLHWVRCRRRLQPRAPSCARRGSWTSAASATRRIRRASGRCDSSFAASRYELLGVIPSSVHLFGVDAPGARAAVRLRFVRPRRAVAPAVRRADLADGRRGRHRHLVYAGPAARRHRRATSADSSTRSSCA